MTTKTIKELIYEKYENLIKELKTKTDIEIFELNTVDFMQFIYFFDVFFLRIEDYRPVIKQLIMLKGYNINDNLFEEIYPPINEFLQFIKLLRQQEITTNSNAQI